MKAFTTGISGTVRVVDDNDREFMLSAKFIHLDAGIALVISQNTVSSNLYILVGAAIFRGRDDTHLTVRDVRLASDTAYITARRNPEIVAMLRQLHLGQLKVKNTRTPLPLMSREEAVQYLKSPTPSFAALPL